MYIERLEGTKELTKQIIALREEIQAQNFKQNAEQSYAKFTSSAGLIYNYALAPSLEHLNPGIKQLIIIPDGALWLIPFEMLLHKKVESADINFSPDHLPYLINKYAISYAHNSRLLISDKQNVSTENESDFAGFAPSFAGGELASRSCFSEQVSLTQLEFNQKELEGIATAVLGFVHCHIGIFQQGIDVFAVQRADGQHVDDLDAHPVFLLDLGRGLQGRAHHGAPADQGQVGTLFPGIFEDIAE